MIPTRILEKATETAHTSDCSQKLACILTNKRGKVVSIGANMQKTHPIQKKYALRAKQKKKIQLHAEIAALVKCREQPEIAYVLRVMKNGGYGMARPCAICTAALKEAGVKKVIYSNNSGGFNEMFLENEE